jgi:hypothetical protein
MTFKISAFLFAGLIFFVTFLHQGKKVKGLYSRGNSKPIIQLLFHKKAKRITSVLIITLII